jgi:glycosyltransferase involved in cell wall biosynthesis
MKKLGTHSPRIAVLVFPLRNSIEQAGQLPVTELLTILKRISTHVFLITGNYPKPNSSKNVTIINVPSQIITASKETILSKAFRFVSAQFRISKAMFEFSNEFDLAVLYFSSNLLIMPVFGLRLIRKKIVIIVTGSGSQSISLLYPSLLGKVFSMFFRIIEDFNFTMASKIVVYSPKMVESMGLGKYRQKIYADGYHGYLDTTHFKITTPLESRPIDIGYIGRLTGEKGILQLVDSYPMLVNSGRNLKFQIIGNGSLLDEINLKLHQNGCFDKVTVTPWVPNNDLPEYFNQIKLLVVPSYTEGLPKIILEAMACGTIVLATNVGSIPDVITDGKNGFLISNNSPLTISSKIDFILKSGILENIQLLARKLVVEGYTFNQILRKHICLIEDLGYEGRISPQ